MPIRALFAEKLRCFNNIHADLDPGLNLFCGPNGSGKTTLLEAIDILSRGTSFRTRYKADLIKNGCDRLTVSVRLTDISKHKTILVRKSIAGGTEAFLDGEPLAGMAAAARLLPVRSFHPESHALIHGSASGRRRYLDWGVFHVKHDFFGIWSKYQKCLANRNALLKTNPAAPDMKHWSEQMGALGRDIDVARREYFSSLARTIQALLALAKPKGEVGVRYFRGWADGRDLSAVLEESLEGDQQRATTRFGPHRADIVIDWDGSSAKRVVSRGQEKVLALALILAQIKHFTAEFSRDCVVLVDDLTSELDSEYLAWAMGELKALGQQVVLTSINHDIPLEEWRSHRVFHVKHSGVTPR